MIADTQLCAAILETFKYDPETGRIFNSEGDFADRSLNSYGYRSIWFQRKNISAHRMAFVLMEGKFPSAIVDHINGIKTDNRWANLRLATKSLNGQNQKRATSRSTAGLLGVTTSPNGRFAARIQLNGIGHYIGSYATAEEAHQAYLDAKRKLHPGNTL